jgi:DNA-binding GntR family transcriptional regulator
MNFKEATDGLFDRISHEELAEALGVSVASIRQARLSAVAKAYREPPRDWKGAVIRLAEKRLAHYNRLVKRLQGG